MQPGIDVIPDFFDGLKNRLPYEVLVPIIQKLVIAIFIGLLIGLEREHAKRQTDKIFAGIRTFPLIAIAGFVSAFLSEYIFSYAFPLIFIAFGMLVWIAYFHSSGRGHVGITTEITALLVFILSGLVYWNFLLFAGIVTVVVAIFLSFKVQLHNFAHLVEEKEIYAVLKLAILSVIILPLLPSRTIDPLDVINPRILWLLVIFVAGISFCGYLLTKFIGYKKGISYTAIFGGLVSSTALTFSFSKKSKENSELSTIYGNGIVLASLFIYPKVLIYLSVLDFELFALLLPELTILFVTGLVIAYFNKTGHSQQGNTPALLQNPFEMKAALMFGLIFMIILLTTKLSQIYFGSAGSYIISVLAGITNIDAITISLARVKGNEITNVIAANSILFALLANTISKLMIARVWGTKELSLRTTRGFGILLAVTILILSFNLILIA